MRPFKEFLILIGKQSLYFGEGRHKDTQNLQKGEVKGTEVELYIANLLRRIINLQVQNDILTREDISRLGKMLYNFLKEWNLDVAFRRFYREIAEIGNADPLTAPFGRIYLEFVDDAELLAILPWEYLSYGENDHFLGAHKDFKFDLVRRISFQSQQGIFSYTPKPAALEKANILLILAEPKNRMMEFGAEQISAYFEALLAEDRIGLKIISQPTFESFPEQLDYLQKEGFKPDVIHFAGLGEINENSGFVGLIDSKNDEKIDWVEDRKFIEFLNAFLPNVKLVFLHACLGGMVGDFSAKKGMGLQFLQSKVPSLVAMQAPVKPQVAFDFAQVFYASLLAGEDVARAVTSGREKLCFELQEKAVGEGGKKDEFNKRVNPYGDKSFGIPVIYITTEEPFSLIEVGKKEPGQSGEPTVYYECQNRPNPRCVRIKLVERDEQGCPVCGGPLVAIQKQGGATNLDEGSRGGQSAQRVSGARVPVPEKIKGGKASPDQSFVLPTPGETPKTTTDTEVQVILFLAANPKDSTRLRLDEEARRIKEALGRSKHRDKFELEEIWAVQIPDLRRALLDKQPGIIHFSGHGSALGRIYLEDPSGNGQEVSAEALGNLFKLFKKYIRCVILNACYSEVQAKEITKHGIPVIGMTSAVPDKTGVVFSEAFYDALGAGENLEFAFDLGCSAIEMDQLKKEDMPVLLKP
ncbi:MAG: CHAT domain-containing protein [Saprospirales bacterium]|nr:CHAT domain-containing protein [Saprospirales bacterium]